MFLSPPNSKENKMKYRILPLLVSNWTVQQSTDGKKWIETGKEFEHENEAEGWIDKEIKRIAFIKKRISDNPPREYPESPVKLVK